MNTPEKPIIGQPPAPPVPQWLLDAVSHFELVYTAWIAGWEAGIHAMTPTVMTPEPKQTLPVLNAAGKS
jgi:hypothetical protein